MSAFSPSLSVVPGGLRRAARRVLGVILVTVTAAVPAAPLVPLRERLAALPCDIADSRPDAESWLDARCRAAVAAHVPRGTELGSPHVKRAIGGWTLRYTQLRQRLVIQDAILVVSLRERVDGTLDVRIAADSLVHIPEGQLPAVEIPAAAAERIARERLLAFKPKQPAIVREVGTARLELDATGTIPAWSVVARGIGPVVDQRFLISALDGSVLDAEDLVRHVNGQGRIFDPNPILATRDMTLEDQGDAASAVPPAAYSDGLLLGLDPPVAGLHRLAGTHVSVEDLLPPNDVQASEVDPAGFNYLRDDDRFEQVMVYHGVDTLVRHVRSLGLTDVLSRRIRADAHAQDAEGSFFTAADFTLAFGDGGVDDAEDADVIVHEACHAILEDVVPGFAGTGEAGAIGEGIADFMAATRHAWLGVFPACVAPWDGSAFSPGNPPCSRRVDSLKVYPDDIVGDIHEDGEIWSAALWDVRVRQGADTIEQILLQSLFLLPANPSFRDAAAALLQADVDLGTGAKDDICFALTRRGFLVDAADCGGLSVARVIVDDTLAGDGDGWLEPGEDADLLVGLRAGIGPVHRGTQGLVISRSAPDATMLAGSLAYPDIPPETIADPLAPAPRVRIDAAASCGARLSFDAAYQSDQFDGAQRFTLDVGEIVPGPPSTGTYPGPPIDIPDNDPAGIAAPIALVSALSVGSVAAVVVDIAHSYRGDLLVELVSPTGTRVRLHDRSGGGAADLITTYPTLSPVEGPGALDDFVGEPITGDWTLEVMDVANNDLGQLRQWGIAIETVTASCAAGSSCTVQEIATGLDGLVMVSKASGDEIVLAHPGQASACATGVQVRRASTARPTVGLGRWPLDPAFADVTGEDRDPGPLFRHSPPAGLSCYLVVELLPSGLPGPSGSYGR